MKTGKRSGRDERGKLRFASQIVILAIVNITLYTAAAFVAQWLTELPPPDSLTVAFFAFWGTELAVLALKRIMDGKNKNDDVSCE